MKTIMVLGLALVLSTAVAQKADLSMKFKTGQSYRYKEVNSRSVTAEGMPGGGQTATSTRYVSFKVLTVTKNGTAEILRNVDSSNTLEDGKPTTNPQVARMDGIAMKVTMTKSGKILDAVPVDSVEDEQTKKILEMMSGQYKQSPSMPGKVVSVGETWNDEITNNQDTQVGKLTITMHMKTTFTAVQKMDGKEVAVLDVSGTLNGELGVGMGIITGTVKGKRYFAHKEGREHKMELAIDQNMDMQTPQGNMMMQTKMTQERTLLR